MAPAEGLRRAVRGLSEAAFRERFGTGAACREALFAMRWREGLACPACGRRGFCALTTRKVFQCNRCKKQVSLTAGTVFQDTKLPLTVWFAADLPPDPGQGRDQLDRARAPARGAAADGVAGEAQADAGDGRARGRRSRSSPAGSRSTTPTSGGRHGGKRGRGAAGETPIVAAVETTAERRPKRLRLTVVKGFRKREVEKLAKAAIEPGATVVSDGLSCWPAVEKAGCAHFAMATGAGKRAASWTPFRWVNTTLGNVKAALAGTYHHVSPKHAQSYLTSYAYRFDRRFRLDSIVERLAWAAVHTAPQPYRVVVADV